MADPKAPELPKEAPEKLRKFLDCTWNTLDYEGGKLDWLPLPDKLKKFPKPSVSFKPGKAGSVFITLSLGFSVDIPASVQDGQLVVDTTGLDLVPDEYLDAIKGFVDNINAWFKFNNKKLDVPSVSNGSVHLSKIAIAVAPQPGSAVPGPGTGTGLKPIPAGPAGTNKPSGAGPSSAGPAGPNVIPSPTPSGTKPTSTTPAEPDALQGIIDGAKGWAPSPNPKTPPSPGTYVPTSAPGDKTALGPTTAPVAGLVAFGGPTDTGGTSTRTLALFLAIGLIILTIVGLIVGPSLLAMIGGGNNVAIVATRTPTPTSPPTPTPALTPSPAPTLPTSTPAATPTIASTPSPAPTSTGIAVGPSVSPTALPTESLAAPSPSTAPSTRPTVDPDALIFFPYEIVGDIEKGHCRHIYEVVFTITDSNGHSDLYAGQTARYQLLDQGPIEKATVQAGGKLDVTVDEQFVKTRSGCYSRLRPMVLSVGGVETFHS